MNLYLSLKDQNVRSIINLSSSFDDIIFVINTQIGQKKICIVQKCITRNHPERPELEYQEA